MQVASINATSFWKTWKCWAENSFPRQKSISERCGRETAGLLGTPEWVHDTSFSRRTECDRRLGGCSGRSLVTHASKRLVWNNTDYLLSTYHSQTWDIKKKVYLRYKKQTNKQQVDNNNNKTQCTLWFCSSEKGTFGLTLAVNIWLQIKPPRVQALESTFSWLLHPAYFPLGACFHYF